MPQRKPARNRVNYASQFLYSCFDATGYHFSNHESDDQDQFRNTHWNTIDGGNQVRQLHRIQSINYGFQTDFIDINEYGKSARIDKTFLETPNVSLDFEYALAEGYNEQVAGFVIDGENPLFRKLVVPEDRLFGQNFFTVQVPDGHDVINSNLDKFDEKDVEVVGIGNAFLNQYAVTAEIGSLPKARMSYEASNIRSYKGFKNLPLPSYNFKEPTYFSNAKFSIPNTYESFLYEKLKAIEDIVYEPANMGVGPGNLKISLDDAGYISKNISDLYSYDQGAASIQGFTLNISLGNTRLSRIGTYLEFGRTYNFPLTIQFQVRAILGDIRQTSDLCEIFQGKKHNIVIMVKDPRSVCEGNGSLEQAEMNMAFYIKGATLNTEAFSSSISDNKIVDLNFTAQYGGIEDRDNGLFMYGSSYFPDKPRIVAWGRPLF
jgi:hypothetical protein